MVIVVLADQTHLERIKDRVMRQLLFVLLLTLWSGCLCDRDTIKINEIDLDSIANRTFDIEAFNKYKHTAKDEEPRDIHFEIEAYTHMCLKLSNEDTSIDEYESSQAYTIPIGDSIKITYRKTYFSYYETWEYSDGLIADEYEFFLNGKIRRYAKIFEAGGTRLFVGEEVDFDEDGKRGGIINHDDGFSFTLEDILNWMTANSIDVNDENVRLYRGHETNLETGSEYGHQWGIEIRYPQNRYVRRVIDLDPNTGEILSDKKMQTGIE